MQIVFLNRLDRTDAGRESRGQVFIGESQGLWTAGWRLMAGAGSAPGEEIWYEGISWEELLAAFRHGVAVKMKEGYRPLIDGMLETPIWQRQPSLPLLLQCYAELQPEKPELMAALKQWRRTKAAEENRMSYLIATNRELQMLAVYAPRTAEELQQIPGFGKMKTQRYGAELIAILRDVPREHSFPLDWVAQAVDEQKFAQWVFRLKEEKYSRALNALNEKRALLAAIREGKSIADLEQALQLDRRQLVERIEKLDEEGYDVLSVVDLELSDVTPEEWKQASEAMSELGDRYLKPLLQRVYGEEGNGPQDLERKYEKLRMMRIRFRHGRQYENSNAV